MPDTSTRFRLRRISVSVALLAFASLAILSIPGSPLPGSLRPDSSLPSASSYANEISEWYSSQSPWAQPKNWKVVANFTTPWGREVRLRPICADIEVRGADLRVTEVRPQQPAPNRSVLAGSVLTHEDWRQIEEWASLDPSQMERSSVVPQLTFAVTDGESLEFRQIGILPAGPVPWSSATADGVDMPIEVELILDSDSRFIVEVRDARLHASGKALIFDPNPIAASGQPDLRDTDPTAQFRVWVDLKRLDGSGRLSGEHVAVSSDLFPKANSSDLVYDYLPYDPRFEEAMAYYHSDRTFAKAAQYGYTGLLTEPLKVRVHGTQLDNSWYARFQKELVFGDGGVDDAEDGDIILHESAHALHDALAPGFDGAEMFAISEGFADFWAASLTGEACVGDWDATSYSPPCLRTTDNSKVYPGDLSASPHRAGLIFSGLFWDLRAELGAEDAENLALGTLVELGPGGGWSRVGESALRAAVHLNLDARVISRVLIGRGLLNQRIVAEVEPGAPLEIDLVVPGHCLGETVTALSLAHDGTLRWSDSGQGIESPAVRLSPIFAETAGVVLEVALDLNGEGVRILQSWRENGKDWVRVQTDWNAATGSIEWTYLHLPRDGESLELRLDKEGGPLSPTAVDLSGAWDRISAENGIVGALGDAPHLLMGSRFALSAEDTQVWLERRTPIRTEAWAGLQLSVFPNPVSSASEIRLFLEQPGPISVSLYGAAGRELANSSEEVWLPAGLSRIPLPRARADGRALPTGRYWARAVSRTGQATVSFVKLR